MTLAGLEPEKMGAAAPAACLTFPSRWRMGNWRQREACRAEQAADKLARETAACKGKGPAEADCTGFTAASEVLKGYAERLRGGAPK